MPGTPVRTRASGHPSVGAASRLRESPLHETLSGAGGQMIERCGSLVARDFGSAASEAALCQRTVGIADRSDLVKLELSDRPEHLLELIERSAGGRAVHGVGLRPPHEPAWWCLLEPGRALILCDACHGARVLRVLELAPQRSTAALEDCSEELAALAIVGPRARRLLAAVGDFDLEQTPAAEGFVNVALGGQDALLLREGPVHFLAVVPAASAEKLWAALHEAGHELGVGSVGHEAIEHLAVNARTAAGQE